MTKMLLNDIDLNLSTSFYINIKIKIILKNIQINNAKNKFNYKFYQIKYHKQITIFYLAQNLW